MRQYVSLLTRNRADLARLLPSLAPLLHFCASADAWAPFDCCPYTEILETCLHLGRVLNAAVLLVVQDLVDACSAAEHPSLTMSCYVATQDVGFKPEISGQLMQQRYSKRAGSTYRTGSCRPATRCGPTCGSCAQDCRQRALQQGRCNQVTRQSPVVLCNDSTAEHMTLIEV